MKPRSILSVYASFYLTVLTAGAQPFALTDTGTAAPDFRKQFLASYGVNPKIEPEVTQEDRPLYERIEPYLRNNPRQAIRIVEEAIDPETNAAFHFLLGNLYYQTGQRMQAERTLERAVKKFQIGRAHV